MHYLTWLNWYHFKIAPPLTHFQVMAHSMMKFLKTTSGSPKNPWSIILVVLVPEEAMELHLSWPVHCWSVLNPMHCWQKWCNTLHSSVYLSPHNICTLALPCLEWPGNPLYQSKGRCYPAVLQQLFCLILILLQSKLQLIKLPCPLRFFWPNEYSWVNDLISFSFLNISSSRQSSLANQNNNVQKSIFEKI